MKIAIKTLIALTLTTIILNTATAATFAADDKKETTLTEVKKVNKVNVSGNVELILVQSALESVKVYDNYYAKNALVQQKDGELRISSFDQETLTVIVYVNNLVSISAADNATVKTFGRFNSLSLTVDLQDKAIAVLNTNTIELNTNLSGLSKLTLTGFADTYNCSLGSFSNVNMDKFNSLTKTITSKNAIAKAASTVQLLGAE